jgi:4-amino-4-deoxy-L-arabinose transferase-like glycosyltransferase
MDLTAFTLIQQFHLLGSAIVFAASIVSFQFDAKKLSLGLLFAGTLSLGFWIATLDPFLVLWDEQFHALVAKHMLDNPLKPVLYADPLLAFDYHNWVGNHVWVHKQPLFLWQIALSLKVFGINELAVRIPSIVQHALATVMVYRIGKISTNASIGFYGAIFFAVGYYLLELVAGKIPTDHNDSAFLFYVTASIWAWVEYTDTQKKYWIVLIGLFSGCAVMVKWLVGLLIYAGWTVSILPEYRSQEFVKRKLLPVLVASTISVGIFLPWQLYILTVYPLEAGAEFQLITKHFYQVVEDHGGDVWFHFQAMYDLYGHGRLVPYLVLIGWVLLLVKMNRMHRIGMFVMVVVTYIFYSIAATKMTSFTVVLAPFGFLALGALCVFLFDLLSGKLNRTVLFVVRCFVIMATGILLVNLPGIKLLHTFAQTNEHRKLNIRQMEWIQTLRERLPGDHWVVFNAATRDFGSIPVMFYTNYIAYDFIPSQEQLQEIDTQLYQIVVVEKDSLPEYITNNSTITRIKIPRDTE